MKFDPKINKEIDELLKQLQFAEDIDPVYMDEGTKEIRHRIFHVHERTEIFLEILLSVYALSTVNSTAITDEQRLDHNQRFTKIISSTDISKKIMSCQDAGLISGTLGGKIFRLNNLRNIFAHPSSYQDEIRTFRNNPAKELETYKFLLEVYDDLNALAASGSGMTKTELRAMEVEESIRRDKKKGAPDF